MSDTLGELCRTTGNCQNIFGIEAGRLSMFMNSLYLSHFFELNAVAE